MIIYGTALLAACHLLGIFLGDLLGKPIGVKTNVGGVGIAMILDHRCCFLRPGRSSVKVPLVCFTGVARGPRR